MKLFLFSVLGVILLIPILYFVPLQLNRKMKFLLIATSFLLAVLGSLANQIFPLWNTILIIFLLAGLSTYFIGKRVVHAVGVQVEKDEGIGIWEHSESNTKKSEEVMPNLAFMKVEQASQEEVKLFEEEVTHALTEDERLLGQDSLVNSENHVVENDHIHYDENFLPSTSSFTESSQMEEEELDIESNQQALFEMEDDFILEELTDRLPELDDDTFEHEISEEELLKERQLLFDELGVGLHAVDELQEDLLILTGSDTENEITMDERKLDAQVVDEGGFTNEASKSLLDDWIEPLIVEEDQKDGTMDQTDEMVVEHEIAPPPVSSIPREIFYSLIEEIEWTRQHMPTKQFEGYLRQYLAPSLPDHEFFVFSSLLRDFFIRTGQKEKCRIFLLEIQSRFAPYPVLDQEIQYFLDQVLENIDR